MSTLKAPSMSNITKRYEFLLAHPEYPNWKAHLEKIINIKAYKESKLPVKKKGKKSQADAVDGAEFYKQLKEQEKQNRPKKDNFIKKIFKAFVRKAK